MGFRPVVAAELVALVAGIGCTIPSSMVVASAQSTYECPCSYTFCAAPTASCGCTGATVAGEIPTYLCETAPGNIDSDCANACAALAPQFVGSGCLPQTLGYTAGSATLVGATSCNANGQAAPVIAGGVADSYDLAVGGSSTLTVTDSASGSTATTAVQGSLSYTLNGAGGISLNLISLQFSPFDVDLSPVIGLELVNQGPATGTISGTTVDFPKSSLDVTISGQTAFPQQTTLVLEVADPYNDSDVGGTFAPLSNSFVLQGVFYGSDFVSTSTFQASLYLEGAYTAAPPVAATGGPYTSGCSAAGQGVVSVDASASTDGNGSKSGLVYQWFEGSTPVATGATADLTLGLGAHTLTLVVFDAQGEFASATTTATVAASGPVITGIANTLACLAPPNDLYVRYDLGDQITVTVQDACDPNPTVTVVGVSSNEPDGGAEVSVGTTAFCIQSATIGEETRIYTVQLQATDSAGLTSAVATTTIEVPSAAVEADPQGPADPGGEKGGGSSSSSSSSSGGNGGSCGGNGNSCGNSSGNGNRFGGGFGNGSSCPGGGLGCGNGKLPGGGKGGCGSDAGTKGGEDAGTADAGDPPADAGSGLTCVALPSSDFIPAGDPRCNFSTADAGSTAVADAGTPAVGGADPSSCPGPHGPGSCRNAGLLKTGAGNAGPASTGPGGADAPEQVIGGCSSGGGGAGTSLGFLLVLLAFQRRRRFS
jgi:uncharacterized protein (TIGR03382 family)